MKRYYKAVSIHNGQMRSFSHPEACWSLGYELGRRTVPRFGGILAFETPSLCEDFILRCMLNEADHRILVGTGEERVLAQWAVTGTDDNLSEREVEQGFRGVWDREMPKLYVGILVQGGLPWPHGTVALSWFEPEGIITWPHHYCRRLNDAEEEQVD